ncbi:MAG: hypothetical protein ACTSPB_00455 [Candidatus Thorarchaeota archaeon]
MPKWLIVFLVIFMVLMVASKIDGDRDKEKNTKVYDKLVEMEEG